MVEYSKKTGKGAGTIKEEDKQYDSLQTYQVWGYGVGHFLNDLIASYSFTFLGYFFVEIQVIDKSNPGKYAG